MNTHTTTLPILYMNIPRCATRLTNSITSVPPFAANSVVLSTRIATLWGIPSAQAARDVVIAVREAEYDMAANKHLFITAAIICGGRAGSVITIPSTLPGALAVAADKPLKRAAVEMVHGTVTSEAIPSGRCGNDTSVARDIFFSSSISATNGLSTAGIVNADMTGSQRIPHIDYADGGFHIVWGEAGNEQPYYRSSTLIGSVPFHELAGCRSLKGVSCLFQT